MAARRLIILGSTGSIGTQALDVVAHINDLHARGQTDLRFDVVGLAAGRHAELLSKQAERFGVKHCALAHPPIGGHGARFTGPDGPHRLVTEVECDIVLAAMVGAAGLPATLAAAELGRDIALANKESLVAAGSLVVAAAKRSGSKLLPVDSEHSGVWQALAGRCAGMSPPFEAAPHVRKITLTASGGPFRTWTLDQMRGATVEQARKHPTWTMGDKVTIDSASLMNKALELIEAHWLFGVGPDRLDAVIHPQSIVHAMVEFTDRSVMAQLAAPDMRTPIHSALVWPREVEGCGKSLSFAQMTNLTFEPIDAAKFPAIPMAFEVMCRGGTSGAIFNAANETAVQAFVAGRISFTEISEWVARRLDRVESVQLRSLSDVLEADAKVREAM